MSGLRDEIEDLVNRRVREGFDEFDDILEGVVECVADEHPGAEAEPLVRVVLTEAWSRARREQLTWTVPTDCDRLDRAFAALERAGVVARQNFSCCQNCGHGEIGEEIEEASKTVPVVGYAFYHMQDTEHAAEGEGLYLAYGDLHGDPEAQQKVGWTVVEALRREGLMVEWNGSIRTRIRVSNLVWQRRRDFTSDEVP